MSFFGVVIVCLLLMDVFLAIPWIELDVDDIIVEDTESESFELVIGLNHFQNDNDSPIKMTVLEFPSQCMDMNYSEYRYMSEVITGEGWVGRMKIFDNILYSADDGIVGIDISNASEPTILSRCIISSFREPVYYSFENQIFAYRTGNGIDLRIYNVTDPNDLSGDVLNQITITPLGSIFSMFVQGNFLYICDSMDEHLFIYDLIDPLNPSHISNISTGCRDVFVQGDYTYLTSGGMGGPFHIVNVTEKTNPQILKTVFDTFNRVFVQGNYAFVQGPSGTRIFDVEVKDDPILLNTIPIRGLPIYITGDYAFLGDTFEDELFIVDIRDKMNPLVLESFSNFGQLGYYLTTKNNNLFIGLQQEEKIVIYRFGEYVNFNITPSKCFENENGIDDFKCGIFPIVVEAADVNGRTNLSLFLKYPTQCYSYGGSCNEFFNCSCHMGHSGVFCDDYSCFGLGMNDIGVCSGHGKCLFHDNCVCDSGYFGEKCIYDELEDLEELIVQTNHSLTVQIINGKLECEEEHQMLDSCISNTNTTLNSRIDSEIHSMNETFTDRLLEYEWKIFLINNSLYYIIQSERNSLKEYTDGEIDDVYQDLNQMNLTIKLIISSEISSLDDKFNDQIRSLNTTILDFFPSVFLELENLRSDLNRNLSDLYFHINSSVLFPLIQRISELNESFQLSNEFMYEDLSDHILNLENLIIFLNSTNHLRLENEVLSLENEISHLSSNVGVLSRNFSSLFDLVIFINTSFFSLWNNSVVETNDQLFIVSEKIELMNDSLIEYFDTQLSIQNSILEDKIALSNSTLESHFNSKLMIFNQTFSDEIRALLDLFFHHNDTTTNSFAAVFQEISYEVHILSNLINNSETTLRNDMNEEFNNTIKTFQYLIEIQKIEIISLMENNTDAIETQLSDLNLTVYQLRIYLDNESSEIRKIIENQTLIMNNRLSSWENETEQELRENIQILEGKIASLVKNLSTEVELLWDGIITMNSSVLSENQLLSSRVNQIDQEFSTFSSDILFEINETRTVLGDDIDSVESSLLLLSKNFTETIIDLKNELEYTEILINKVNTSVFENRNESQALYNHLESIILNVNITTNERLDRTVLYFEAEISHISNTQDLQNEFFLTEIKNLQNLTEQNSRTLAQKDELIIDLDYRLLETRTLLLSYIFPVCNGLNSTDPEVCSSHGICIKKDLNVSSSGICFCQGFYTGDNCEKEQVYLEDIESISSGDGGSEIVTSVASFGSFFIFDMILVVFFFCFVCCCCASCTFSCFCVLGVLSPFLCCMLKGRKEEEGKKEEEEGKKEEEEGKKEEEEDDESLRPGSIVNSDTGDESLSRSSSSDHPQSDSSDAEDDSDETNLKQEERDDVKYGDVEMQESDASDVSDWNFD